MKRLLTLLILFLSAHQLLAEELPGTLTFEGEHIVFRSKNHKDKYEIQNAPGLRMVSFTPKIFSKDEKETDISEIVLELSSGNSVTLIVHRAYPVVRITNGKDIQWRFSEK